MPGVFKTEILFLAANPDLGLICTSVLSGIAIDNPEVLNGERRFGYVLEVGTKDQILGEREIRIGFRIMEDGTNVSKKYKNDDRHQRDLVNFLKDKMQHRDDKDSSGLDGNAWWILHKSIKFEMHNKIIDSIEDPNYEKEERMNHLLLSGKFQRSYSKIK